MDTYRAKYPRTRHLPSSRAATEDDKHATAEDVERGFGGQRVIITEKMDGENTTIYADGHSHARSIDSKFHPSRSIVKEVAARVASQLPTDWRICGENLFAVHSIEYDKLPSHFQVFSIWNRDTCLDWDSTREWCELLDLDLVPVMYDGPWVSEAHAHAVWTAHKASLPEGQESEGFVVRVADAIAYDDFKYRAAKFVRQNHVQTDEHWMHQAMRINKTA